MPLNPLWRSIHCDAQSIVTPNPSWRSIHRDAQSIVTLNPLCALKFACTQNHMYFKSGTYHVGCAFFRITWADRHTIFITMSNTFSLTQSSAPILRYILVHYGCSINHRRSVNYRYSTNRGCSINCGNSINSRSSINCRCSIDCGRSLTVKLSNYTQNCLNPKAREL